ncbi:MAG TPA: type IV pilus assembly protein PilM [Pirellulales bacterium]|jgi:type IV pilus assembly protein PilM|nr:type IV pilus assembly protein PilM [Pirellulales bacterium]
MVGWPLGRRNGPIGIDVGARSVKLMQLSADRSRIAEAVRWDFPAGAVAEGDAWPARVSEAVAKAREGRAFRGRDAVLCLGVRQLFVQNLRVAKVPAAELEQVVREEAAGRLPFPVEEADLRYLEAADVRHGDMVRREVIVMACHRPVLDSLLGAVEQAGLRPVAVDAEPLALLRCYARQFRRDEDKDQRAIFVHVGATNTAVIIAQGDDPLFIKYIDLGGQHFDEAVARHLQMSFDEAWALRRHNGDRRADQQDPEVARSVAESLRPAIDRLAKEISLCIRYHSVTFRGQPLVRLVLGGGEAASGLAEQLAASLNLKCELGDPLRSFENPRVTGRKSQWDVTTGLVLREVSGAENRRGRRP